MITMITMIMMIIIIMIMIMIMNSIIPYNIEEEGSQSNFAKLIRQQQSTEYFAYKPITPLQVFCEMNMTRITFSLVC